MVARAMFPIAKSNTYLRQDKVVVCVAYDRKKTPGMTFRTTFSFIFISGFTSYSLR